jgi:hypothetical protein
VRAEIAVRPADCRRRIDALSGELIVRAKTAARTAGLPPEDQCTVRRADRAGGNRGQVGRIPARRSGGLIVRADTAADPAGFWPDDQVG